MFSGRRLSGQTSSRQRQILFIGTFPEPMTGQSLACQVLLEDLRTKYDVTVVDLVKSTLGEGMGSASRILEVCKIGIQTARAARHADLIYITIAESVLGNMRDLLLYLVNVRKLKDTVVHLHGGAGMRELMSDRHRILRGVNVAFLKRLGAVIVLGDRHLPIFEPHLERARLVVVPNFAPDDVFVEEGDIRSKFESRNPLRVLFLSNLIEGKGWKELLTAYEQLDPSDQERIELSFAGTIASQDDEELFFERLDTLPTAHYYGTVRAEAKAALLARSHVFCLPTFYAFEGQPISILEAYASGCVVVTTDHSGIFDIFEPGLNGVEVAPRSPASLRSALSALLDRDDLAQIGVYNSRQARSRFRAEQYCVNVGRVIEKVLEPGSQDPVMRNL